MQIPRIALLLAVLYLPGRPCVAQSPLQAQPPSPAQHSVAGAQPVSADVSASAPAARLQPSLDKIQQTLSDLRLERWKRGTVRDEATGKIGTVLRDLHETLPPLLAEANAAPGTVSKQLSVSRNLDALYDVLLRIFEAARVAAPAEQISPLDQALAGLHTARLAFDDSLKDSVAALEKQASDLQAMVKAQAAIKCPPPPEAPVCPAPAPAPKPRRKPKPPTPAAPSTPAAATSPKPAS